MKSVPLPRIGMRVVKTAVAVMLSYTIFVPFGLIYNEALGGVWGQLGPLYACIACIICTQSTLGQTIQQGLSRLIGVAVGGALGTATLLLGAALDDPWVRIPALGAGSCVRGGGVDLPAAQAPPPAAWRASCPASFSSPASPA